MGTENIEPLKQSLTDGVDVLDGDLDDLSPDFCVEVHRLLGADHLVGEVVVVQVLPHVVKSVQHVGALPHEVLEGLKVKNKNK